VLEESFLIGASKLDRIIEMVHWLIRLRLVSECFVLNNTDLAAIMAEKWPGDYQTIKDTLPSWILFFNIAACEYLPEERISGQKKDMEELSQRIGIEAASAIGKVSASDLLEISRHSSKEPYWKLRYKGACHDIFFLALYDKLPELIKIMHTAADEAGYPTSDIGVYLQPIVQGVNCHCEFNLYFDPENHIETKRLRDLSENVIKRLMENGAFFSRPYGESAEMIMNRDAATVAALKKVKSIVDPDNIMNPGKLCF
jgi:hypothetical protein